MYKYIYIFMKKVKDVFHEFIAVNKDNVPASYHFLKRIEKRQKKAKAMRQVNVDKLQTSSLLADNFYKAISRPVNISGMHEKK